MQLCWDGFYGALKEAELLLDGVARLDMALEAALQLQSNFN